MAKTQIEIEIPDGYEIVEIRYGSSVMVLDKVDSSLEKKSLIYVHTRPAKSFIINGVPSDWPEWLTCDWVAKDKNEILFGYDGDPPTLVCHTWAVTSYANCGRIFGTAITIPGPWEQSLRKNPRKSNL